MDDRLERGVWLVDKPAGPTSHDVVARIRRGVGRGVKVGHTGTLDPFASGLLVVVTGRATRLVPYLTDVSKRYTARIALGAVSDTGDPDGVITPTGASMPDEAAVVAAVARFVGPITQRVPAYAAVKVDGERLYRRTRRGEQVDAPVRDIVIHHARVVTTAADRTWFDLDVACSKGTYIRQLAADIGESLGTGAHCAALRRTAVGGLSVDDAVAPEVVPDGGFVEPVVAVGALARRDLTGAEAEDVAHGRPVRGVADGPVALVFDGRLVGIGHAAACGTLRPKVVLA